MLTRKLRAAIAKRQNLILLGKKNSVVRDFPVGVKGEKINTSSTSPDL